MYQFTCEKHPGQPAHHDDCEARGVSWSTVKLKTNLDQLLNAEASSLDHGFMHDLILAHRLHAAVAAIESDHSDFLAFLHDEFAKWPCMHDDGGHASTPPMMWPELLACIVKRAVKDALEQKGRD